MLCKKLNAGIVVCCLVAAAMPALAAEKPEGGDLRSAVQNPISSLISVPLKLTIDFGAENGEATILNINPVVPVTVGNWNLVSRALIPLAHVDGAILGPNNPSPAPGGSATGLGDINYSLFFSPVKYDKVIWGVGPSINLPTATSDQLGSGKWSAGVTAVALTQPGWGSMGILGRQLWSFAGDSNRSDVNQTLIEPFVNYNLEDGWFLISGIAITAKLESEFRQHLDGARWWRGNGSTRVSTRLPNQGSGSNLPSGDTT